MAGETPNNGKRRMGPVGFDAESAVTKIGLPRSNNAGGLGWASAPKKETARRSRDLKVFGPGVWLVLGIVMIAVGLAFKPFFILTILGLAICVGSLAMLNVFRTQQRVRLRDRQAGRGSQ